MCDLSAAQSCYPPTGSGSMGAGGGDPGAGATATPGVGSTANASDEWPPTEVLEWFAEMQQSVTMYHAWKNWLPEFSFQHCPSKLYSLEQLGFGRGSGHGSRFDALAHFAGPMNRPPPPLAHTGTGSHLGSHSTGHIFSPPQTPTPSRPGGQDMLGGLGPGGHNNGSSVLGGHHGGHGGHLNLPPISSPNAHPNSSAGSPLVVPQPIKGSQGPGGPPGSRAIKTYHCRMCDQIFESKSDLLVHSQHVHKQDPKPYKCPTCNKCFANSSYLSQHARIHSGIKPYKCQICERRFTQLCHLQQHIRTHTGEKPYKCQHPGCGKAFSQLSNLQSHSRSHMTDKPYRCNSCYKCFADEHSLREHIPKHSETKHLKTHICRICGKSYTQETYLARHMTKHNVDGNSRMAFHNKQLSPGGMGGHGGPGGPLQGDPHDIKPLLDGNGSLSPSDPNKASAFMPLAHQFQSPNLMNSSVPSTIPFPSPRLPNNSLNSPLNHLTAGSMSSRYFPFDPISFPKTRDPITDRSMSMSREGMIANSLLSLQQIKNFSTSHPVFPKSEPSSPSIHKEYPKEFP